MWQSSKGDNTFDNEFNNTYFKQWGREKSIVESPSVAQKVSCEFLYANSARVIAGFTGWKKNKDIIS